MANEFIIRKGFQSQADSQITGSLTVITGSNIEFQVLGTGVNIGNIIGDIHNVTGSLRVSGSITGSLLGTSSFATSASYAPAGSPFPFTGSAVITGSALITGSLTITNTASVNFVKLAYSADPTQYFSTYLGTAPNLWDIGPVADDANTIIRLYRNNYIVSRVAGSEMSRLTTGGLYLNSAGASPVAMLQIKGSGSASTSTALKIINSSTSASLTVLDDRTIILNSDTTAAGSAPGGYFYSGSYSGNASYILAMGKTVGNDLWIYGNDASVGFMGRQGNREVYIGHYAAGGTANITIGVNGSTNSILMARPTVFSFTAIASGSVTILSGSNLILNNGLISASYGTNNTSVGGTPGWTSGARNVNLGIAAQGSVTTTSDNVSVGYGALKGGTSNTSVGSYSSNTATGTGNTVMGYFALSNSNDVSNYKVAIGYEAMYNASASGDNNSVGIGFRALYWTKGIRNTAVGSSAGQNVSTGRYNTFLGSNTGVNTSTGEYNIAVGYLALSPNTSGSNNIAIGRECAGSIQNSNDSDNILIGQLAGGDTTSTKQMYTGNIGIGYYSLYSISGSSAGDGFNIGIGYSAMQGISTGLRNISLGYRAGYTIGSGGNNVLIGHQAGYNTKLNSNVAIGTDALYTNYSGSNNVAVGRQALYNAGSNSTAAGVGGTNVGIGGNAGTIVYSGVYNVYIGYDSGTPNSGTPVGSGSYCTFVGGYSAVVGSNGDSGDYNTGVGYASFGYDGSGNVLEKPGSRNTGLGIFTLSRLSSSAATRNTAIGAEAGRATTSGGYNTYLGASAGNDITTGTYNLMLGYNAGDGIDTGVNNTIIGSISGLTPNLSDTVIIAAGTSERMRIDNVGNVGINTTNPDASAKLQVDSNTSGFLPPRMTNTESNNIASPKVGLIVYCTDETEGLYVYKSSGWTFIV